MVRKVVIEPVTRIEGHAKVAVHLDDDNQVERAYFHVNEFRGFEKFCEGRMFFEMPLITERICGICPVSHHLASAKACDQILGVDAPRPAQLAARADAHGPDHPVALDALLRAGRPGPAAGLRRRSGHPQRGRACTRPIPSWSARPSSCASSARIADLDAGRPPHSSELCRARRREQGPGRGRPRRAAGRDRHHDRLCPGGLAIIKDWVEPQPGRCWQSSRLPVRLPGPGQPRQRRGAVRRRSAASSTRTGRNCTSSTAASTWTTSPSMSSPGPT